MDATQGSRPSFIPLWRMQEGLKGEALLWINHQKKIELEKKISVWGMEGSDQFGGRMR